MPATAKRSPFQKSMSVVLDCVAMAVYRFTSSVVRGRRQARRPKLVTTFRAHASSTAADGAQLTRAARIVGSASACCENERAAVSSCSIARGENAVRAAPIDAKPLREVSGSRSVGSVMLAPSKSRTVFAYWSRVRRRSVAGAGTKGGGEVPPLPPTPVPPVPLPPAPLPPLPPFPPAPLLAPVPPFPAAAPLPPRPPLAEGGSAMTPVQPAMTAEPAIQRHARTAARRHPVAGAMEIAASPSV